MERSSIRIIILNVFLALLISNAQAAVERVGVMTFNVENLFDTTADKGKNDFTYRPLSWKQDNQAAQTKNCAPILKLDVDPGLRQYWHGLCMRMDWSEENLEIKMQRLAKTILQVNHGHGPDILFLQEVENKDVLKRFNKNYLQDAGYRKIVLIEGQDARGIDVAIMTRLPLEGKPKLHAPTKFSQATDTQIADTRQILEATVRTPDGELLSLFALHLPAHHLPRKMREEQTKHLKQLVDALPEDRRVIAAGDFNINKEEDEKHGMYEAFESHFYVSHHNKELEGTYYYNGWSTLDAIMFSEALAEVADVESIRVLKGNPDHVKKGRPNRFRLPRKPGQRPTGVSDHLPVYMEFLVGADTKRRTLKLRDGFEVKKWNRVAFFDADSTLRIAPSGSPSANTPTDVRLLPLVAEKIIELNKQGYLVAVVSNQGGVSSGLVPHTTADAGLRYMIELIEAKGGHVDYYDFADYYDRDRKGSVGMAERLERKLRKVNPEARISTWYSFMVGDAAYKRSRPGKPGDTRPDGTPGYNFSNSDRKFAENYGIKFYEPRDFFNYVDYDPEFTFFHSDKQVQDFEDKYLK